ncbi:hypothetical protein JF634_10260 [Simonsiella muelleri]|uniref:Roadblock/LAMTOR2 domain-containing protein n=1 Tax=Simonsiella muelleri ATCC 29453 TaxID=641147 RepID=V9HLV6_9NEIS|nr:hypothetical protein [Simonsiella muelleri]AUX61486.1 hypothetical protein BWP33_06485 [Simonsiella muelleri ATCC 29453]EFG30703.1 hypothetical protein HMPREF9021_01309 [Simonsiella muelleri ATCC 29453]UBQ53539.1 hypothetical protein JF634_10260 [Simonsiella muelleri]
MSRFPKAIDILSQIQELEGAIIFNFSTKEILGKITREIDLTAVVDILSTTVKHHQNLICELELLDMIEQTLITSNSYYHITYIVPQFDNVAVHAVVSRYTMLPYTIKMLEDAVYSMR